MHGLIRASATNDATLRNEGRSGYGQALALLYLDGELLAVGDLWLCESSRWAADPAPGEFLWQPRWERNITTAFD